MLRLVASTPPSGYSTAEQMAQQMARAVTILNLPGFADDSSLTLTTELLQKSRLYSVLDTRTNPMKGTGVQKQRKSALETTCSAKYVSDIAFSNQEDHNDWVTRLTNSVQMPPYVRGLLRGGLLALTRENVRIFSDVPGVFSPTAYLYDFGGSDMPTADALAIAVTGWHGECADLNAVNVRTRLRATLAAESSNHPVWVFLDTTPSNAEAFQRTHMRLTAAFPDHYGTEACAQLPLSVYVRNGVSFTVAVQKVGDAIFTCPGLHHTVLTPMGSWQ